MIRSHIVCWAGSTVPGNRVGHDLVDLGQFPLHEGANRLEIKMLAGSENSPRMFGLDYVRLEPASSDSKQ